VPRKRKYIRKYVKERRERRMKNAKKETEEAKTKVQVWNIVNRQRKKWKGINKDIEREEWERYFRETLAGIEKKVRGEKVRRGSREDGELEKEKIRRAIGSLKNGKAIGIDGVSSEVWKHSGEK